MTQRRRYALLIALVGAVCFVLGWLAASRPWQGHPPAAAPTASVEIHIDAGSVDLLPDGGLHLKPIPPLDLDAQ